MVAMISNNSLADFRDIWIGVSEYEDIPRVSPAESNGRVFLIEVFLMLSVSKHSYPHLFTIHV